MLDGVFRRRQLPHWDVDGKPIFITACLEGSISSAGLTRIRSYRNELERRPKPPRLSLADWEKRKHKLVFKLVDALLDRHSPVCHLRDERQAKIVQDAFLHFAESRYHLFAFVVMPSHHHWVFLPSVPWSETIRSPRTPREAISQSIQSYTATMCNRLRGESGAYWQTETFDHWLRDEGELFRVIAYIENNPVEAGLVSRPDEWPWSSARIRKQRRIACGEAIHVG